MGREKETVEFEDVTVKAETEKALLVVIDDEEHWIPKNQIDDDSEVYERGTSGKLVLTRWICEQKNLV